MTADSSKDSRKIPSEEGETVIHEEEHTLIRAETRDVSTPKEKTDPYSERSHLVVLSGPLPDRFVLLDLPEGGIFLIGRDPNAQMVLDDGSVSRRHAEIVKRGKLHFIRDLGSSNGTLVEDRLISQEVVLPNNAQIKLGIYHFVFLDPHLRNEDLPKQIDTQKNAATGQPYLPLPATESFSQAPYSDIFRKLIIAFGVLGIFLVFLVARGLHKISKDDKFSFPKTIIELFTFGDSPKQVTPFFEIKTSPIPGKIHFQGEFLGQSPIEKQFTQGFIPGHDYELRAEFDLAEIEEKVTITQTIQFTPEQMTFSHLVEAPIGQLHIMKLPRNVQVLLEYTRTDEIKPNEDPKLHFRQLNVDYKQAFYIPFGSYKLELRKNENFLYRRRFEINEANMRAPFAIEERDLTFAPITILSNPAEAEIILDGETLNQKTPLRDFSLPLGAHTIVLKKENYDDLVLKDLPNPLQVNEPLTIDVNLPITQVSELILRAKTNFDQVSWEESVQTLIKAQRSLPPPSPREKAEIQLWLGKAYVKGQNLDLALRNFLLARNYTDENKKNPFLDDASLGEGRIAHLRGNRVKALQMAIEVFFRAQDDLLKHAAEELFVQLSPARAAIRISSNPQGATIWINGEKQKAVTPVILADLSLGSTDLLVTKKGYRDRKETLRLGLHDLKAVEVTLEPL